MELKGADAGGRAMNMAVKLWKYDYRRMHMGELRELAKQEHPEHSDEAARVYVDRLTDLELERRLDLLHRRPGWHTHSPVAMIGCGGGGTGGGDDQMVKAYEKGIPISYWHDVARVTLGKLPTRRRMALLIQMAKMDSRLEGPWCATFDQIAASIGLYSQMLGWGTLGPADISFDCVIDEPRKVGTIRTRSKHRVKSFKDGKSIKNAAREARCELLLLAKLGVS